VRERVRDYTSFIQFSESIEKINYLSWDRVLRDILPTCSVSQIDQVLSRLGPRDGNH